MCRGEKAKKIESKRQIHIEPKERPPVLSLRNRDFRIVNYGARYRFWGGFGVLYMALRHPQLYRLLGGR